MPDEKRRREAKALATLLDDSIRVPWTGYRIGLDAIIGLIPGLGDIIGGILSTYIVARAVQLGVPKPTILRMASNIFIETVVGAIPLFGDLFDAVWKANLRNYKLLESSLIGRRERSRCDTAFLVSIVLILTALIIVASACMLWLLQIGVSHLR